MEINEVIKSADKITFLTGAGISEESGIPTFRGKDGLWKNHDVMKLATIAAFEKNPKLVWEWYVEKRETMMNAKPNKAHYIIAELEKKKDIVVLTQNIDGLHQKAESTNIIELHGNITRTRCVICGKKEENKILTDLPPKCECNGLLRPDVVWFGEPLLQDAWKNAVLYAKESDVFVIVGTSLEVSPANMLPHLAERATLVEINKNNTNMTAYMDYTIRDNCSNALSGLFI